ncbi:MAG: class I SAM-dependent methyltransferase [Desulfuromusa sp.]|nr:class I SAM-dependent methyltransferase [Desulfuromusa sp.]
MEPANQEKMVELLKEMSEQNKQLLTEIRAIKRELFRNIHEPATQPVMKKHAAEDSAEYLTTTYPDVMIYLYKSQTLDFALEKVTLDGQYLEFGVSAGRSITQTAKRKPNFTIYGFDSFFGLPEDWTGTGKAAGDFDRKGKLPPVPENVTLIQGWFKNSISQWRAEHEGPIAFCHIDCDLYSSTVDVLKGVGDLFQKGTILVFDDYFGYPNWRNGEHKAFLEFLAETGFGHKALAISNQVLVVELT